MTRVRGRQGEAAEAAPPRARAASPPSSRSRMFSVLWICTPSLLARAWSRAVFPGDGQRVRRSGEPGGRGQGGPGGAGRQTLRIRKQTLKTADISATVEGDGFPAGLLTHTKTATGGREMRNFWILRCHLRPGWVSPNRRPVPQKLSTHPPLPPTRPSWGWPCPASGAPASQQGHQHAPGLPSHGPLAQAHPAFPRGHLPCLSAALTSAPRSRRRCRQGKRSGSSLARSKGLLSWI